MWQISYSKLSVIDVQKLKSAKLDKKSKQLIELLRTDPFAESPPYERLVGNLRGMYSRRINYQHRLVYTVDQDRKVVRIIRMWTHYEKID